MIPPGWLRVVSLLSRLVLPSIARVPPPAPRATLDRLSDAITVTPRAELARSGSGGCGGGEGGAESESEGEGEEAGEAGEEEDGLRVARPRRSASVDGEGDGVQPSPPLRPRDERTSDGSIVLGSLSVVLDGSEDGLAENN